MITIPGSITGAAQTGFTTPGYTTAADAAVEFNQRQSVITAATGTQVGVTTHSVASPFTIMVQRPKSFNILGKPDPVTGLIRNVGRNVYKMVGRKGVTVLAGQPLQIALFRAEWEIPAGADLNDAPNIKALFSACIGCLNSVSAGFGDTALNGVL